MHIFGAISLRLQRTGNPMAEPISRGCFELSGYFFRRAYGMQQRQLAEMAQKCVALRGTDLSYGFEPLLPRKNNLLGRFYQMRKIASARKLST